MATEVRTLDPRFSTGSLDIKINRLLHAGLAGLDPDSLEPRPLVAESWQYLSDQQFEVTLRQGLKFHSGRELSANDVCETINALRDPSMGSPHRAVVSAISACEVRAANKVVFSLTGKRASLLSDLEVPILRADEVRLEANSRFIQDGLGPYRLSSFSVGEVKLEPADTGVMPKPAHHVVVRTVHDANARVLRLLAGRSDIAPNSVVPTLFDTLAGRAGLSVAARAGSNVTYLLVHNARPPFESAQVRQALSHAVDRALICQTLLAERGEPANFLLPRQHWAGLVDREPLAFDLTLARRELQGKGPVSLLTSTDRLRVTLARAVAQMLNDAGLSVQVVPLDLGVLLDRLDRGDFSLAILQLPELTEPNVLHWFFHSSMIPGESGLGKNRARYRSPEADALLSAGAVELEHGARAAIYRSLGLLMLADMPVVPLWHEQQVAVLSARARGFSLSAEGRWLALASVP